MATFAIGDSGFSLDGKPFRILGGAVHYFRVPTAYWEDRLLRLKACGLNTVETYVAWNMHEPSPGQFRFDGALDLAGYLRTASRLGLKVVLRPGPYICSEWDLGGLPSWLLRDPAVRLRCMDRGYIEAVDRYFDRLFEELVPLQCTRGGPILAMQVENEYGSYGNDLPYLTHLAEGMRRRGVDVPLFTSDGGTDAMLQGGTLPGVLKTVNFGSRAAESFAKLGEYQAAGPRMCTEFWNGWFDHWGEEHHLRDPEEAGQALDEILSLGASVIVYVFHGGTNFGFWNGANHDRVYQPTITSYDDDAPVGEAGDLRPKYAVMKRVLSKHFGPSGSEPPALPPRRAFGSVELGEGITLLDALPQLGTMVHRTTPVPMEELGQSFGFVYYRTRVTGPRPPETLELQEVRDRALIFLDGTLAGLIERDTPSDVRVEVPRAGVELGILVENMGRINYGPLLADRKGITEGVRLGRQFLYHWEILPLPLEDLSRLSFRKVAGKAPRPPAFLRGSFDVDAPADTFLHLPGWTKGVAWVNGANLGRYWNRGPQRSLYVPGPLLGKGRNKLVIFELQGCEPSVVELRDVEDLG
jgi:beta-galactosidase